MPAVVEMRTYKIEAGKRDRFVEIFQTRVAPAHREIGMAIVGPFLSVDDPDTFFWMRGFPDAESRDRMKDEFYGGRLWKEELEGVLLPMLEHYDVVLVEDADGRLVDPQRRQ